MIAAVKAVRERAIRATTALDQAGIPYAVAGGNAVAAWVARVDKAAVRNTQDVDIIVRRSDLENVKSVLSAVEFFYENIYGVDCFLDGASGNPRNAVHVIFASEKERPTHPFPAADVAESTSADDYRILNLDALVRMKLNSFRDKDRTHLRDLIDVGLVDQSWTANLDAELAARLQQLIDDPEG
jgi:hypothetical protein